MIDNNYLNERKHHKVVVINGSKCGRDRPGFGCDAVYQKLRLIQYYKV
jgi:hypothetical protein